MLNAKTEFYSFWYPEVLATQIILKFICKKRKKITKHDFWCRWERSKYELKGPTHIIISYAPSDMIPISDFAGMTLHS